MKKDWQGNTFSEKKDYKALQRKRGREVVII